MRANNMSDSTPFSTSRTEQRSVIKHCVHAGVLSMDTYHFLKKDKSKPHCSRAQCFVGIRYFVREMKISPI